MAFMALIAAFMALIMAFEGGAGAAAFVPFIAAFAFGMAKGGAAKSACKMFVLTSPNGYRQARACTHALTCDCMCMCLRVHV